MSHSIEIRIVNVSILGFYSLDLERGGGLFRVSTDWVSSKLWCMHLLFDSMLSLTDLQKQRVVVVAERGGVPAVRGGVLSTHW